MMRGRWFAKKTECLHGHKHDSKGEANHCIILHLRQAEGEITNLRVHQKFYFSLNGQPVKHDNGRRVAYTADFDYFEGHSHIVDEFKGGRIDPSWPIRRAFFRAIFPYIELRVVRA